MGVLEGGGRQEGVGGLSWLAGGWPLSSYIAQDRGDPMPKIFQGSPDSSACEFSAAC
jgi:hypothetical protein